MRKTDLEKGAWVTYTPRGEGKEEVGKISSWNEVFVFVKYGDNTQATRIEDLTKGIKAHLIVEDRGWSVGVTIGNNHVFEQGDNIVELKENLLKAMEFTFNEPISIFDLNFEQ